MNLHKILFLFFSLIIVSIAVFQSCGSDNNATNNNGNVQTTIKGSWIVESAQMVEAPSGSGPSEIMKQNLQPLGMMPASSVGYCSVIFGDSTWSSAGNITNTVIKIICGADDSIYTASGMYTTNSNNITFVVQDYSGPQGNQNAGSGTYTLDTKLTIDLLLPDNEKWKIILKR